MIKWYGNLYIGDRLSSEKAEKIREEIDSGNDVENCWIITTASNPENELELRHSLFLKQESVRGNLPMIVGLAASRPEALELIRKMTDDIYRETGGTEIREFFEKNSL